MPPEIDRRRVLLRWKRHSGRGWLSGMRIRKKLIVLHTCFSLVLCGILLVALRPAVAEVVQGAELDEAKLLLNVLSPVLSQYEPEMAVTKLSPPLPPQVKLYFGTASELGIDGATVTAATGLPGKSVAGQSREMGPAAVAFFPAGGGLPERFCLLQVTISEAREAVFRMYVIILVALLAVYGLVAVALEGFVMPQSVYEPIRRMLAADRAVQEGQREVELIDPAFIPDDELGEIMRSRNESVLKLRRQEKELASALLRLEEVANDLKRKNHLLETARRNLADADRLASLGMMSAGIAHELNTPLAVVKGLVEKLNENGGSIEPSKAALMRRVVGRIERLGESLLDFARVRPPRSVRTQLAPLLREAVTLVALDRETSAIAVTLDAEESLEVSCDADRMIQVFVNVIRNAADAVRIRRDRLGGRDPEARGLGVRVIAGESRRDERDWVVIRVIDDGNGIDPAVLPSLFEPFVSTRLDARGTGLGLAVADGIVREHGGLILARNRTDTVGAVFEIVLPRNPLAHPEELKESSDG